MKISGLRVFCVSVLFLFVACSAHQGGEYTGTSELMCGHFHGAIDVDEMRVPSFHGTIRVQVAGHDNTALPNAIIYLKKDDPKFENISTVTTREDGSFQENLSPGTYHMETCHIGFASLRGTVVISPDAADQSLSLLTITENTPQAKKEKEVGVKVIRKD